MRCLYCGKELALFKRLTGGGEFCSDAHRQKYQEEYNQLALSRLLQASPVAEGSAKAKGRDGRGALDSGGSSLSSTALDLTAIGRPREAELHSEPYEPKTLEPS